MRGLNFSDDTFGHLHCYWFVMQPESHPQYTANLRQDVKANVPLSKRSTNKMSSTQWSARTAKAQSSAYTHRAEKREKSSAAEPLPNSWLTAMP